MASSVKGGVNVTGILGAGGGTVASYITAYKEQVGVYKREIKRIMRQAGEIQLAEARANIVNDTGALSASGRVILETSDKGTRVRVKFGGEDYPVSPTRNTRGGVHGDGVVDYAFFVHEDIHPKGFGLQPGAKFLEKAELATRDRVKNFILKELRKAPKVKSRKK